MRFLKFYSLSNNPSWSLYWSPKAIFMISHFSRNYLNIKTTPSIWDTGELQIPGVWDARELRISCVLDTGESRIAPILDTGESQLVFLQDTKELRISGIWDTRQLRISAVWDTREQFFDRSLFSFLDFKPLLKPLKKQSIKRPCEYIIYNTNTFDSCFNKFPNFLISDRLPIVPDTRESF